MKDHARLVFRVLVMLIPIAAIVATSSAISYADPVGDLLYVSSWDGNIYRIELATGSLMTINAGLFQPEDVAVNSRGQVFVTEVGVPRITRFEADGSGRTVIQLPFCCPEGSSFDIFDNLYFNTNEPHSGVWSIAGGNPNNSPLQVIPQFATRGEGTTFLPNGDLLAVDIAGVVVRSSPPGFGSYSVFANTTQIIGIDADSSGRVCVTDREPVNAVECFDKNGTHLGVLATGFNVPRHSEFDSSGDFYVGNFLGDNVIRVSAQGQTSVVAQIFRAHGIGVFHRTTQQAFSDSFDDNNRDPSIWTSFNTGSGPVIAETNQRLEITFPQTSSDDGVLHVFGAGYTSVCQLREDFDIQADFQLLVWPFANGVRLGMGGPEATFLTASPVNSAVERVSFGDFSADAPGQSREVYLTHFSDGVQGITPTSDLSGKLRLVRSGNTLTGYYFGANSWIAIHSGPTVVKDFYVNLVSWSHDFAFANQVVRIAFDNFIVSQGMQVCPEGISVSKFFTDSGLNALPIDNIGRPKVDVVVANGVVRSTNPGQVLAWINITNTGGSSLQSIVVNETLPADWVVRPEWLPSSGAIHVFFVFANETRAEITDATTISVSIDNAQTVSLAIPDLTNTAAGKSLGSGESILLSVKTAYGLQGTSQSASSYPRNYSDTASVRAWTQPSFAGPASSAAISGFFVTYAKVVGDVDGNFHVDILDAALLAYSFGATIEDENWTPNADFDYNGVVDILDAAQLAAHYGTSS